MAMDLKNGNGLSADQVDQLDDARKVLAAYASLPEEKKPILMVIINALISGMEIQETLAQKGQGR